MFFKDFMKNPQTTIALIFLTHIISDIDGVGSDRPAYIPDLAHSIAIMLPSDLEN